MLKDIAPSASSLPGLFTPVKDRTYFVATTAEFGRELWKTDGTAEGTALVHDLAPGSENSRIVGLDSAHGELLITRYHGPSHHSLWATDGTTERLRKLADFAGEPTIFHAGRNHLWLAVQDGGDRPEVVVMDLE